MIKLVKWLIALGILAGIGWGATNYISPWITISSNDNEYSYGDSLTFNITIHNFSPTAKKVYLSDANASIGLLVDGAKAPDPTTKAAATTTVTLPPFSSQTYQHTVVLKKVLSDDKPPQALSADAEELDVSAGQHAVQATWGGHTSWAYTFGVT